jgi:hypothetical protein
MDLSEELCLLLAQMADYQQSDSERRKIILKSIHFVFVYFFHERPLGFMKFFESFNLLRILPLNSADLNVITLSGYYRSIKTLAVKNEHFFIAHNIYLLS